VLAAGAMFGCWLTLALFMLFAHRSGNTSVVALTARFVIRVEKLVMIAAVALQPISGFLLGWAIGLSPSDEPWIAWSLVLYGLAVAAWFAALLIEIRIRDLTHDAALKGMPLPDNYGGLFRIYAALVWPALLALVAIFVLMVWQPRPQ
jgi:uncharacterized membrane protein